MPEPNSQAAARIGTAASSRCDELKADVLDLEVIRAGETAPVCPDFSAAYQDGRNDGFHPSYTGRTVNKYYQRSCTTKSDTRGPAT